MEKVSEYWAQ